MKTRIVFVDDEQELCELYTDFFEDEHLEVTTFSDPLAAIDFIAQSPPDFCVIDYRMPKMNGIELRARLPEDLTCYLVSGELDLACPEGFAQKFAKPLRLAELESLIATFSGRPTDD